MKNQKKKKKNVTAKTEYMSLHGNEEKKHRVNEKFHAISNSLAILSRTECTEVERLSHSNGFMH